MAQNDRPSFSLYDASAGSGKTYALVKEYLRIILTSPKQDAYRNILAITFTNKAVHEMKTRIVGSLSEFGKAEPSKKARDLMQDLSVETKIPVAALQEKSRGIIRHIIHNYAAFDISTIDKFTHRVIRAFAHDLNLPMTFEISLDTESLLTQAVDAIIERAGEDPVLTKLLVDFTMEKTDDDKSWDISREILDTGRMVLNENHRNEIAQFKDKTIPEFVAIRNGLEEAAKAREAQTIANGKAALELIDRNGIDLKSFSGGFFPKHLQSIADGNFNATSKRYHEPEDIRINKTAAHKDQIEAIVPELLRLLQGIYSDFARRDFYRAFLKNITPLSLLHTVSEELAKLQQEQNLLSISEFNAIIHREIQNQPAPFIYERLGEKYRHFFIDEFQDTSELQWQNLIPLIYNSLSGHDEYGQKGTLMIVGDPKQSIYRWRGGKAEQFIALSQRNHPFENIPEKDVDIQRLEMNRRSYAEVVQFNNGFFKLLAQKFEHQDYRELYENKSEQLINDKTGGYVNVRFLPKSDAIAEDEADLPQQYAHATLETILLAQQRGFALGEIVVLVRHNKNGIAIARYLNEQQIPIQSSETLLISSSEEVRFIVHLLRYLKNGADLEAKAHFLYYIGKYLQTATAVHDFIAAGMALTHEIAFEQWLEQLVSGAGWNGFEPLRRKSLYESVELIISHFLPREKNDAYVQYFLDFVLEQDLRNPVGLGDFLDYWDKKSDALSIPSPDGNDAVRIISIHKSKGLEFPVVIFPFADEQYSRQRRDRLWVETDEATFGLEKVLVESNKNVTTYGEKPSATYWQRRQEELLDNINVLYVALTRAEEQLYIISQMQETGTDGEYPDRTASYFLSYLETQNRLAPEQLQYDFGLPERLSERGHGGAKPILINPVSEPLTAGAIKIASRESQMWGTPQQEAIAYGNTLHEILSGIKTENDVADALQKALDSGLINPPQWDVVRHTLEAIVKHPELKPFFDPMHTVFNEQPIILPNLLIKPDRMVRDTNGNMLLLDYKTGVHRPAYKDQVEHYADAIEAMGYPVLQKVLVYTSPEVKIIPL